MRSFIWQRHPNEGLFFSDDDRFKIFPPRLRNNIAKMAIAPAGHHNSSPEEAGI
jgi:hypothetical protein